MKSAFTEGLKVRETLKILETLTYTCEDGDALIDLNMNETLFQFRKCIPTSEGITVRPAIAQRTLIKPKIMRAKRITQKYGSLQLRTKRGPKRLDASYRNRVGKKASSLRKVASHMKKVEDMNLFISPFHTLQAPMEYMKIYWYHYILIKIF